MVGILDKKFCVSAKEWRGEYDAYRVYLGIGRILPSDVSVSLTIEFRNQEEEEEFFSFWKEDTVFGARPFYVYTSLYGVRTHYLVQLEGTLSHRKRPLSVSGTFVLYRTRTLEENTPPHIESQSFSVDMDSANNYLYIKADDYDSIVYEISTPPSHGVLDNSGGGAFYYTPTNGYSGNDSFVVTVTDELGAHASATIHMQVINWQTQLAFKWGLTDDLRSYIDYSNDSLIEQAVKDDLATLSNAKMVFRYNELPQIDYSACSGIVNISFDNDGHMLIETLN